MLPGQIKRVLTYPYGARVAERLCQPPEAKDRDRSIPDDHLDGDPAANDICALIL